jgi:hypothetical protein
MAESAALLVDEVFPDELKTPYRNGTTHVIFEPLDFIAKLAALVPKPRVNLTRFHGVFAPNSKHRVQVTPAKRGKRPDKSEGLDTDWCDKSPAERHRAMTWMQRLRRVFNIDIEVCEHCGGHGGCPQAARVTARTSATANRQPVRPTAESSL